MGPRARVHLNRRRRRRNHNHPERQERGGRVLLEARPDDDTQIILGSAVGQRH